MANKIGFFVLPKGAAATRGRKIGEMTFASDKDRETFVRGVGILAEIPVRDLFSAEGGSLNAKEAGALAAGLRKAMTSSSESTLSSVMSAEVVALSRGTLDGKLDQLSEILQAAAKDGGLLTTLPE